MTVRDKINPLPKPERAIDSPADGTTEPKKHKFVVYDHRRGTFIIFEGVILKQAPIASNRFLDWLNEHFGKDVLWHFHTKGVTRID